MGQLWYTSREEIEEQTEVLGEIMTSISDSELKAAMAGPHGD